MLISSTEFEVSSPIRWIGCSYKIAVRVSRYLFLFFGMVVAASLQIAGSAQAQELTPEMREVHEFRYAEAVDCVGLSQMFDGLEGMAPGFVSQGLAIDPEGRATQDTVYRQVSYLIGRAFGRADDEIVQAWTDAGNGYIHRLNAANATTGLTTTSAFFTDEIMPVWTACEDSRLGAEAWLAAMSEVLDIEF